MADIQEPAAVAAVDLGSNSFHLVIARVVPTGLLPIDRLREPVQLGAGLDAERRLGEEAESRALACLSRFGQRLRDLPEDAVRAVGTDALRRAKNGRAFLKRAQSALGIPIEIISGREEARLIYLGAAHSLPRSGRRLVLDIGGGSTECILGEGFEIAAAESLAIGCLSFTREFFPSGDLSRERFKAAELAARRELQSIERRFRAFGWEQSVGTSGTIQGIEEALRLMGESDGIDGDGLRRLRRQLIDAGRIKELSIPGIKEDRLSLLPGGLAILMAIFEEFGLERVSSAAGGLREGLLYDLLGRIHHEDARERTIRSFSDRYHVDMEQASRVEQTALALFTHAASGLRLGPASKQLLSWAAQLHECGLALAFSGHHKHGAYLVTHSDMPGFSTDEQLKLAALISCHRRRLSRAPFESVPGNDGEELLRLCLILRLAVLLNRARSTRPLPALELLADGKDLTLGVPADWLDEHPLTAADLSDEAATLEALSYRLTIRATNGSVPRR